MQRNASRFILIGTIALGLSLYAATALHAQDAPAGERQGRGQFGGGQFAGMPRVAGEVTAVSGASLTIKNEEGVIYQVVTTDNTRVMKAQRGAGDGGLPPAIKVSDLKVGDGVTAVGNLDVPHKTMHAAILMAVDAATVKALKDNMGKTYITGKVTGVDLDNAKMTVLRSDGVSQTIGFDETTSFRRGRVTAGGMGFNGGGRNGGGRPGGAAGAPPAGESITLADIKVGDEVGGQGSVKAGVFVPTQLVVATPGQGRRRAPADGAPATPATPPPPSGV